MAIEKLGISIFALVYFVNVVLQPHDTQWIAAGQAALLVAAAIYLPLRLGAWVLGR